MSDIKLFRIKDDHVEPLEGHSVALEKSLQTRIERHLETLFGVRFLATEYSTGKTHGGRIDTLGIDETVYGSDFYKFFSGSVLMLVGRFGPDINVGTRIDR